MLWGEDGGHPKPQMSTREPTDPDAPLQGPEPPVLSGRHREPKGRLRGSRIPLRT